VFRFFGGRPSPLPPPDKPKAEPDALNPQYASQTFTVSADVEIRSYEVFLDGNIPDGAKVTDLYNNPKTVFQPGDKFKVLIPADQISNATGNFEVTARDQLSHCAEITFTSDLSFFRHTVCGKRFKSAQTARPAKSVSRTGRPGKSSSASWTA
jgi:hypothetical protein